VIKRVGFKALVSSAAGGFCLLLVGFGFPAGAADAPTIVNGVDLACTGIGQTRKDTRWEAYGVRLEFSNARNEYLTGAVVVVRDARGRELVNVACDAPWILLKLPKGAYRVDGRLLESAAKPRSAPFRAPASGQLRVVLQFPDA
jgi:hypothetical protein